MIAAAIIKHKVKHCLQRDKVLIEEHSMINGLLELELQFLDPDFMKLQVDGGHVSLMVTHSLVPAVL